MQKVIRDSIVKQQREAKDLGQFRKQRLFQNICKKNQIGEEKLYTSQSEGHQLYDAHLKKMKSVKHKTIEDIQKDRANPIGVDRKKIRKANDLLYEVDKKEKQLNESTLLKQQVIKKQPVDKYGAKDNQFYYDSLEVRSLNEFMFFYEILKRIKAEKQHEEQRQLFKAKLQKIWELEAQANCRGLSTISGDSVKESDKQEQQQSSRIQSASSQNSRLKLSVIDGSPQTIFQSNNLKSLQIESPSEISTIQFQQQELENLTPSGVVTTTAATTTMTGTNRVSQRPFSGRMGLTQRVEQLKQRESNLKKLAINSQKESNKNSVHENNNTSNHSVNPKGNKVDQKVGTDDHQIPTSTKSAKNQKEVFSGTSKFMTMKQADIQLVELLEKIRKTTKTKEKKEQTQNLIVPGMKKGFNAWDINNVVDQAIERAEKTKNVFSMQSFTTLDQNNLKVPLFNRLQRNTDIIQRDREPSKTSLRNASDYIIQDQNDIENVRRESLDLLKDNNKLFRISSSKPSSVIKLTEGIRSGSPPQTRYVINTNEENNPQRDRDSNHLNPIQEDEQAPQTHIRRRSLLFAGLLNKEAPLILLNSSQQGGGGFLESSINKNPTKENNKSTKISFQIKVTKEEDLVTEPIQDDIKTNLRMSELIDISHAQNLDKMNMLDQNFKNNTLDISNIKHQRESLAPEIILFDDAGHTKDLQLDSLDTNKVLSRKQPNQNVLEIEQDNRKHRSSLDFLERDSQIITGTEGKKITLSLDRNKKDHSLPDLDSSLSPQKIAQGLTKTKSQTSQSNLLVPNRESPVIKGQSFKDISMTFTKKEIDKFDIEKRILENLDKIGKQLRIQKRVDLPQKLQSRTRLHRNSAKEQMEKHPFKFSPSFISNWVDLRAKIEQKFDIPSKFQVHKILNQRIRELKHQKLLNNSADNSFYVYQPEYTTYYL